MGAMGITHWLIVAVIVLVLFGRGKVASLMGEVGKGITAFKKGMNDPVADADAPAPQAAVNTPTQAPAQAATVAAVAAAATVAAVEVAQTGSGDSQNG